MSSSTAESYAASKMVCSACGNEFPSGARFCPHDGQALEELQSLTDMQKDKFVGAVLDDRYHIESRLGHGGMGVVYAARHVVIDKPVAIKILRHEYCRDPGLVERFMREARAASRIGHPNIVDVTDFGRLPDGHIYFVMEYLVGVTLSAEIRSLGYMPIERVLDLSIQMCHGLQAAHNKGIVHRDLKPENVFILNPSNEAVLEEFGGQRKDFVKLLDFGIAKFSWAQGTRLTKVGSIFGTPQYMSPEQAAGQDADYRGDIYSLGCMVYEMVTGEVPFLADTFMGTLTKHMFEKPMPPRQLRPEIGIPEEIETVILRAMQKDPGERYQHMHEMATALNNCYRRQPRAAPPMETFPPGDTNVALSQRDLEVSSQGLPVLLEKRVDEAAGPAPSASSSGAMTVAPEPAETAPPPTAEASPKSKPANMTELELGDLDLSPPPTRRRERNPPPTELLRAARRRSALPWVATLFGLALAGGTIYLIKYRETIFGAGQGTGTTSSGSGSKTPDGDKDKTTAKKDPTPAVKEKSDDKALVKLMLVTDPPGALVKADGNTLGRSPVALMLQPGRRATLTFNKRGFFSVKRQIKAPDGDEEITVHLRRKRHRRRSSGLGIDRPPRKKDLRDPFPR
ncbi:MAG: protein kinase [Myxococcales bacterium]|nr:protein kinase [Myxococcales bacterium]